MQVKYESEANCMSRLARYRPVEICIYHAQSLPKTCGVAVLCMMHQAPSDEDDEGSDFQVVHGPVGEHASDLPPATQKVLAALQYNQAQLDALAEQWQRQRSTLKADQSKIRAKLAQDRRWEEVCNFL